MLKGKVSVVTGSTSGIGLGIAEALAGAGSHVMLNGFGDASEIEKIRSEMEKRHQVKVRFSGANMMNPEEITGMIHETEQQLGSVDILVNNAGIQHVAPTDEFPVEKWDAIIAINLSAAFHTIRAVLPGMKAKKWGRIINIASAHGLVASPYKPAYVAAKHGMVGLTKVVALEIAEARITCNAICPGYVLTPLVENQIEDQAKAHKIDRDAVIREVILERQPNKEFVKLEDLAQMAIFLASDAAAAINGAALPIDGGWTAQ
jgi:3-hydroxybutyrate dehydrogenase